MLAVPHLIQTKGSIVNVSSVNGIRSVSTICYYLTFKMLKLPLLDRFMWIFPNIHLQSYIYSIGISFYTQNRMLQLCLHWYSKQLCLLFIYAFTQFTNNMFKAVLTKIFICNLKTNTTYDKNISIRMQLELGYQYIFACKQMNMFIEWMSEDSIYWFGEEKKTKFMDKCSLEILIH